MLLIASMIVSKLSCCHDEFGCRAVNRNRCFNCFSLPDAPADTGATAFKVVLSESQNGLYNN